MITSFIHSNITISYFVILFNFIKFVSSFQGSKGDDETCTKEEQLWRCMPEGVEDLYFSSSLVSAFVAG